MHFDIIALVFGVIFIAELPDKSLFASLVLGSRYPSLYVWLGASMAFFIHVVLAVTAGHFLTLLPHKVLEIVVATLFLFGALLLFLGKHGVDGEMHSTHKPKPEDEHKAWRIFGMSFSIIFIGEWGDITQIATANYAAKYHDPFSVGIGATLGLWAVAGLAAFAGSKVLKYIPPKTLQFATGSILLAFALFSGYSALK